MGKTLTIALMSMAVAGLVNAGSLQEVSDKSRAYRSVNEIAGYNCNSIILSLNDETTKKFGTKGNGCYGNMTKVSNDSQVSVVIESNCHNIVTGLVPQISQYGYSTGEYNYEDNAPYYEYIADKNETQTEPVKGSITLSKKNNSGTNTDKYSLSLSSKISKNCIIVNILN